MEDLDIKNTMLQLNSLTLAEKAAVDIEQPTNDYILHIASQNSAHHRLLAATNSGGGGGGLRLYNRDTLAYVGTVKAHSEPISGVCFSPQEKDLIYTASLDKTIKCWDLRVSKSKHVSKFEGPLETCNRFSCLDISCDDITLCAGTEPYKPNDDTFILFWDTRKIETKAVYGESHNEAVTQIKFHPTGRHKVATGSMDGLVCVFDLQQNSESDALEETLNAESGVSQMGWCGKKNRRIYCTSASDTFHIWDAFADELDKDIEFPNIMQYFEEKPVKVEYLVDCFQPPGKKTPYLVAGSHSGDIHVLEVVDKELEVKHTFSGGHTDTVRCLSWDPQSQSLVTGGEDSLLCLWKDGSGTDLSASGKTVDEKHKKKVDDKRKTPGKEKHSSKRKSHSKPY